MLRSLSSEGGWPGGSRELAPVHGQLTGALLDLELEQGEVAGSLTQVPVHLIAEIFGEELGGAVLDRQHAQSRRGRT